MSGLGEREELAEWLESEVGGSSEEDVLATADAFLASDWLAAYAGAIEVRVRETIRREIQEAKPAHMTRDYTPVDAAFDNAARIALGLA